MADRELTPDEVSMLQKERAIAEIVASGAPYIGVDVMRDPRTGAPLIVLDCRSSYHRSNIPLNAESARMLAQQLIAGAEALETSPILVPAGGAMLPTDLESVKEVLRGPGRTGN